jgi:hypothetical protein
LLICNTFTSAFMFASAYRMKFKKSKFWSLKYSISENFDELVVCISPHHYFFVYYYNYISVALVPERTILPSDCRFSMKLVRTFADRERRIRTADSSVYRRYKNRSEFFAGNP